MNILRIDLFDLLAVQRTLKSLLQHHSSKPSILRLSAFLMVQLSHPHMTTGKTIALTRWTFVRKVISLFFNMISRLVITFLPRSKCLFISWLQSLSAVISEPKKIKSVTVPIVSPSICHEVMGPDAMIWIFWMLSFKPAFSLSSFTFIKRIFCSSLLSAIRVVSSAYLRLLIFLLQYWFQLVLYPAQRSSWRTLHIRKAGWQYTALTYPFSYLELVCCSLSSSNFLPDLHTGFSRGRSGGLVFPSLEEFSSLLWSTQRIKHSQ